MSHLGNKQHGAMLLLFVIPLLGLVALSLAYQRYDVLKALLLDDRAASHAQLSEVKEDVKNYISQGLVLSKPSAPGDLPKPDNFSGGQFPDTLPETTSGNALCANSQLCLGFYPGSLSSTAAHLVDGGTQPVLDLLDARGEQIWYITPRQMFNSSKAIGGDNSGIRAKWPRETPIEKIRRLQAEKALIAWRADPSFLPAGIPADNFARDDVLAVFALAGESLGENYCLDAQRRKHPNVAMAQASFFNFAKNYLEILPKSPPIKAGSQEKPRVLDAAEQPILYARPYPPEGNFSVMRPRPQAILDARMGENGRNGSCYNDTVQSLTAPEVLPLIARKIAEDIYESWRAFHEFPVFVYDGAGHIRLEGDDLTPRMTDSGQDKTPPPFQVKTRKLARRLIAESGIYRHKDKRVKDASGAYPADRDVAADDPNAFPVYGLPASEEAFVAWIFGQNFSLTATNDAEVKLAKKASARPACPTVLSDTAKFDQFKKLSVPNKWWACVSDRRAKTWLIDWFDHRLVTGSAFRSAYPSETASIKLFEHFDVLTRVESDALGRDIETTYQMTFALRSCPNIRFTMEQNSGAHAHTLKALQQEGSSCY